MATRSFGTLALAVFLLAAVTPAGAKGKQKEPKPPAQTGSVDESGTYQLSADELALDCKRLTGKMQVRIMQVRNYDPARKTSALSRSMQTMHSPLIGGSKRGVDSDAEHRADLAMLDAYNRRLAAKGCRTFNLEAELKPQPVTATPRPQIPGPPPPAARKP